MNASRVPPSTSVLSRLLVAAQLILIVLLLAGGPVLPRNGALAPIVAGLGLGLWAMAAMRGFPWRIVPEPHEAAVLVEQGPYRWIRHPMYTSVLLVSGGWLAAAPAWTRLALWLALVSVLLIKAVREESFWMQRVEKYRAYRQRTWCLLPGVF